MFDEDQILTTEQYWEDELLEEYKSKAINNENYIKLTSSNTKYCPMYEYMDEGANLEAIVFPYLWNTQKYPQVYCYNFNEV